MKIKIDNHGWLSILRENLDDYIPQFCPFGSGDNGDNRCGQWCPLFDIYEEIYQKDGMNTICAELRLCHRTHDLTEINYERQ